MSDESRSARPWLRVLVAFGAGVALSVGAGFALLGRDADAPAPEASPAPHAPEANEPAAAAAPEPPSPSAALAAPEGTDPAALAAPEPPPPSATAASSQPVAPSGTLVLERASFPASGPVRVSFELPEMSADAEPRPVRLVSQPDHRILELSGALDSGRTTAAIEVDPDYLQPGTYLVEVKTTEHGAFPLRRYLIEVR